jgi:hypothetical protein
MNKRVSLGDIIFLVAAAVALVLLWNLFSPPAGLVISCLLLGASLPIIYRLVRRFLPKSLWSLPIILVITVITPFLGHEFSTVWERPGVFFAVFGSALATGACAVEFSLRPFFPLKSGEKHITHLTNR